MTMAAVERARCEGGLRSVGDVELVALVGEIREAAAASVLAQVGGLSGLARAGPGQISASCMPRAIGARSAFRLAAAVELGRRATDASLALGYVPLPDPGAVAAWAATRLTPLEHEELWLLATDARNGLRATRRVAVGGLHGVHVGTRDVLRAVLREGGSSFVLVHNHPSGDPTPSTEDVAFTRRVAAAADVVGTPLLDHVVVGREGHVSMLAAGELRVP